MCDLHPMPTVKGISSARGIMDLIRQKHNVEMMANLLGLTRSTIINRIVAAIRSGNEVLKADLKHLADISEGLFQQISTVLPTDNTILEIYLSPLKQRLPDHITYDQIRLVLAYHQVRYHLKHLGFAYIDPDAVEPSAEPSASTSPKSSNDVSKVPQENVEYLDDIENFEEWFTESLDDVIADLNIPVETKVKIETSSASLDNTDDEILEKIDLEEEIRKKNEQLVENYIETVDLEEEMRREMGEHELEPIKLEQIVRQEEEDEEDEILRLIDLEESICRDATNIAVNTKINVNNFNCTTSAFSKESQQAVVKPRIITKPGSGIKYDPDSDDENDDKVTTPPAVVKRKLPSWFDTGIPKAKVPAPSHRDRNNLF